MRIINICMKNHWLTELRRQYYESLLHESHIALWRLKCREEDALSERRWAAANVAAIQIDAEKELYRRLKERLAVLA